MSLADWVRIAGTLVALALLLVVAQGASLERSAGRAGRYLSIHRRRMVFVIGGVAIALVPTAFTISPSWGDLSGGVTAMILIVWVLFALIVVYDGVRQAEQLGDLYQTLSPEQRREQQLDHAPA